MKVSRWETGLQHHYPSLGCFSEGFADSSRNREEAGKANPFPASALGGALKWTDAALSWRGFCLEAQRRR